MEQPGHRELDRSLMTFDTGAEIAKLKAGAQWQSGSRAAITLAKNDALRIVLVALRKGGVLHEHRAEGPITLAVLEGSIRFTAGAEPHTLARGTILTLGDGITHEVEALEDSAFALTVIQQARAGNRAA
jgi:quercetin dioxygenase-like cupin family protein